MYNQIKELYEFQRKLNEFPKRKELFQFHCNGDKEPQVYFVRKAPLLCTRV